MAEEATACSRPDPSVALVILSYNYARFVGDAVESALNQLRPYEQIIVVDDGSTDDSRVVLERYRGRVELLFKENGGQLSAALYALRQVRCDYVHFLDSDDYVVPHARALIADELQHGTPAKLQFRLRCVDGTGSLESIVPAYPDGYDNLGMLRDAEILGMPICPPTSGNVFSVQDLRSMPQALLDGRDYIDGTPNLFMPYRGEVRSLPSVIANYRIHGANNGLAHAPAVASIEVEVRRLRRRWTELRQILPGLRVPPDGSTLFELEAQNLIAALEGRRDLGLALRYARALGRSHMPARQKALLGPWMLSLAVAPEAVRHSMICSRRSAMHRSKLMRKLVSLFLGNRTVDADAGSATSPVPTTQHAQDGANGQTASRQARQVSAR